MRVSIRSRLILTMLTPLLAIALSVFLIDLVVGRRQATSIAETHLRQLTENHAARLDREFVVAEQEARAFAAAAVEQDNLPQIREAIPMLGRALIESPGIAGAEIVLEPNAQPSGKRIARYVYHPRTERGPDGMEAAAIPETRRPREGSRPSPRRPLQERGNRAIRNVDLAQIDPNFESEPWYVQARSATTPVWSEPMRLGPDGPAVTRCTAPLRRNGEFLGVIAFDVPIGRLQRLAGEVMVEGGYCMLISAGGLVVAHPDPSIAMQLTREQLAERCSTPQPVPHAAAARRFRDCHLGRMSWVVTAPVDGSGWTLAAVVPEDVVFAPMMERLRRHAAVMMAGIGLMILVVLLVSVRITRPIRKLAPVVNAVAEGNLNVRAEGVDSSDEIGDFARAFNQMLDDLNSHVDALTHETAQRQAVESELSVAREIQASLLPHTFPPFPHRGEFDLHAINVPAKQVAGDFFDFFFVDENTLALLIADVSGKGTPAALFMAVTRTVIRNQGLTGASPAEVLNRANRIIAAENERDMFVTLFYAHYHTDTGELVYANGGHNPPCIGSADGRVRRLALTGGIILGVLPEESYRQASTKLEVGDTLLLYTDGVTEAFDETDHQFGLERVERILADDCAIGPEELTGRILQVLEDYRGRSQQDDVTLLALKRNAQN